MSRPIAGALGIFSPQDATPGVILELRRRGFTDLVLQSPAPHHELLEAMEGKTSPVRLWTLLGALLGGIGGFALTIGTSLDWPMRTGGKPIMSLPPCVVIAFELTILLGGLSTVLAMLILGRLPKLSPSTTYDPRFTRDKFGVAVRCAPIDAAPVREILRATGADEVRP
jgi:molybdopterin-containing oxidoreductase family membrane subunit